MLLLYHGWDTSSTCAKGTVQFSEVISRGEEFLAQRPPTPRRLDVLFPLAQAYETRWSLSEGSEENQHADSAEYREEDAAAREKAIAYYEEVLRLAPESGEAAYARQRLPRLKAGLDTNQRRFTCIYD